LPPPFVIDKTTTTSLVERPRKSRSLKRCTSIDTNKIRHRSISREPLLINRTSECEIYGLHFVNGNFLSSLFNSHSRTPTNISFKRSINEPTVSIKLTNTTGKTHNFPDVFIPGLVDSGASRSLISSTLATVIFGKGVLTDLTTNTRICVGIDNNDLTISGTLNTTISVAKNYEMDISLPIYESVTKEFLVGWNFLKHNKLSVSPTSGLVTDTSFHKISKNPIPVLHTKVMQVNKSINTKIVQNKNYSLLLDETPVTSTKNDCISPLKTTKIKVKIPKSIYQNLCIVS
jgi:hypothetical protein